MCSRISRSLVELEEAAGVPHFAYGSNHGQDGDFQRFNLLLQFE